MHRVFFFIIVTITLFICIPTSDSLFPYAPRVFRRRRGISRKTNYIRVMYVQQ